MARPRRQPESEPEELELQEEEAQLAQVTERNYTTTTYLKEIPAPAEVPQTDPLEAFLKTVAPDRQLKMHVDRLPNYERDGNTYPGASGRAYLTQFDFTPEMREGAYQSTIQHAFAVGATSGIHPAGGWVVIELREKGVVRHRWAECISPGPPITAPIAGSPVPGSPWPVIIQHPGQPQTTQDPFASFQPVMSLVKGVVGLAKDLIPVPAATPAPAAADGADKPFGERLAEALIIGAMKSDKPPAIGDVLGAINQNREPQWWESIADSTVLTEVVKPGGVLSPLINAWSIKIQAGAQKELAEARRANAEADKVAGVATTSELPAGKAPDFYAPAEGPAKTAEQTAASGGVSDQAPQPTITPEAKAWYKVLGRIVDDCSDGVNPEVDARAIYDVYKRYPDGEIKQTVGIMVMLKPEQVFEMLAGFAPTPKFAAYVNGMKEHQHFLLWMTDLQKITQEIFAEEEEADGDGGAPNLAATEV